jgi:hypothetical protein
MGGFSCWRGGANCNHCELSTSLLWPHLYDKFYVHGSLHRESMSVIVQQDATIYSLLYFSKLLYMFWVVISPIIRSTCNCNYSIWHRLCYPRLSWRSSNFVTTAEGSRDGLTSARCCNYSYIRSSWIVQQDAAIYTLFYFWKLLALHVSGGYSTRHQEHI